MLIPWLIPWFKLVRLFERSLIATTRPTQSICITYTQYSRALSCSPEFFMRISIRIIDTYTFTMHISVANEEGSV